MWTQTHPSILHSTSDATEQTSKLRLSFRQNRVGALLRSALLIYQRDFNDKLENEFGLCEKSAGPASSAMCQPLDAMQNSQRNYSNFDDDSRLTCWSNVNFLWKEIRVIFICNSSREKRFDCRIRMSRRIRRIHLPKIRNLFVEIIKSIPNQKCKWKWCSMRSKRFWMKKSWNGENSQRDN